MKKSGSTSLSGSLGDLSDLHEDHEHNHGTTAGASGTPARVAAEYAREIAALQTRRAQTVAEHHHLQGVMSTLQKDYDALEKQVANVSLTASTQRVRCLQVVDLERSNQLLKQQIETLEEKTAVAAQ